MERKLARNLAEVDTLLTLLHLKSRAIKRQDLNEPRTQILLRLLYAAQNQLPQVELADTLQLSVSQIQKVTEELQKQGLVERAGGAPRGGFFVSLSAAGKKDAKALIERRAEQEFSLLDELLAEFGKGAERVNDVIEMVKNELTDRAA